MTAMMPKPESSNSHRYSALALPGQRERYARDVSRLASPFGRSAGLDVRERVACIVAQTDKLEADCTRLITFVPDRPGHDRRYAQDTSHIRGDLAWAPQGYVGDALPELAIGRSQG